MSFTPSQSGVSQSARPSSVPRGWVTIAAIALVLAALVGTALGVSRSLGAHDLPSDTGDLAPVPNTTLAKALPADAVFDESRIRAIAREEAQAALVRSAPKPKAAPKADSPDDTADSPDTGATALVTPKSPALTLARPTVAVSPHAAPSTSSAPSSTPSPRSTAPTNPYPPGLTPN